MSMTCMKLVNFKCFQNQAISLKPFTLLAGLNGMGKSTVLQALVTLRQSYIQGTLPGQALALNGEYVQLGTIRDVLFEDATEETLEFTILWKRSHNASWTFSYDRESNLFAVETEPTDPNAYELPIFSDNCHYLQAERVGPRTAFETSEYDVSRHHQLGPRGEFAAHYLATFGETPVKESQLLHPAATSDQLRDQVEAWMNDITPGTRLHLVDHSRSSAIDVVTLQFSFARTGKVSNAYRSTNVGFGLTYCLPIFVAALGAHSGALILVENPEAHLHPQGQIKMTEFLVRAAACGHQVIVETHSDHVLNGLRIAVRNQIIDCNSVCLQYFDRMDESGAARLTSPKIDKNGKLDSWPEGFFDQWDKSLEMLF